MASKALTVGIDVGGTFTDLLAVDTAAGTVKLAKVPTTVENQAIGFMASLAAAGADRQQEPGGKAQMCKKSHGMSFQDSRARHGPKCEAAGGL